MQPAFPGNPHGLAGQGQALLTANTFSIVPGQSLGDTSRYVVKGQSGQPLLWAVDIQSSNPAARMLALKDSGQMEVLRIAQNFQTQAVNMLDQFGNSTGTVLISAKQAKEHKKDKYKDGGKREVILQNAMNQPLMTMSGKAKHGGGNIEMKIKSSQSLSSSSPYLGDKKHKDKDHKDKDKKHKEEKDKKHKDDKKNKNQIGEVTGNSVSGFQVHISNASLPLQERMNVVGLLVAYMLLENPGANPMAQIPGSMPAYQQQPHMPNPGMPYTSQVFPIPGHPVPTNTYPTHQFGVGQAQPGFPAMGMGQANLGGAHPPSGQIPPGGAGAPFQMGFTGTGGPAGFHAQQHYPH